MNGDQGSVVNVIVAGVGGQGSILTSHLLAEAALKDGLGVKLAETFGAATRGGSVYAHVRIGDAWAPTIREDGADVVVSLEPVEGLRVACTYLKPGGWALLNVHPWYPVDVTVGRAKYPSMKAIMAALRRLEARAISLDATRLALQVGDSRASNSVILGGLFALDVVNVTQQSVFQAMQAHWSEKLARTNQEAFRLGYAEVKRSLEAVL